MDKRGFMCVFSFCVLYVDNPSKKKEKIK